MMELHGSDGREAAGGRVNGGGGPIRIGRGLDLAIRDSI